MSLDIGWIDMLFNKNFRILEIDNGSARQLRAHGCTDDFDTLFEDEIDSSDNDMDTVSFTLKTQKKNNDVQVSQPLENSVDDVSQDDNIVNTETVETNVNQPETDSVDVASQDDNQTNTETSDNVASLSETNSADEVEQVNKTPNTDSVEGGVSQSNTDEVSGVSQSQNQMAVDDVDDTKNVNNTGDISNVDVVNDVEKAEFIDEVKVVEKVHMSRQVAEAQGYVCIDSAESLVAQINANPKGKFMLFVDIDMSTIDFDTIAKTQDETFLGTFDGNGYEIKNLNKPMFGFIGQGAVINDVVLADVNIAPSCKEYDGSYGALVTNVQNATVSNCSATGSIILPDASRPGSATGGLIGNAYDTVVSNCNVSDFEIVSHMGRVGGVVGTASGGSISSCNFSGNIKGDSETGGILGCAIRVKSIENCSSEGNIDGYRAVGAILGYSWGFTSLLSDDRVSSVVGCKSSANVSASTSDVGGIIGLSQDDAIESCVFTGSVQGKFGVGGVAGWNTTEIDSCDVSGYIKATEGCCGGFTGVSSESATNSTFTGKIESSRSFYDENGNQDLNKLLYGAAMEVLFVGDDLDDAFVGPAILDWRGNKIAPENIDINIDDRKKDEVASKSVEDVEKNYHSIPVSGQEVSFDDKDMKFAAMLNLGKNAIQTQYAGTWVVFDIQTGALSYYVWNPELRTFDKQVLS